MSHSTAQYGSQVGEASHDRGRGKGHPEPQSQRARAQGPHVQHPSHYNTLPDLRFLNHNKPAPTAASILDLKSKNGAGVQQFQALREAEAWYAGTATQLKERLALCERLRDGLGEVNRLLDRIEQDRRVVVDTTDQELTRTEAEAMLEAHDGEARKNKSAILTASGDRNPSTSRETAADDLSIPSTSKTNEADSTEAETRVMEEAVDVWLKDIRVSRAKWIAGGRDMERKIGLR